MKIELSVDEIAMCIGALEFASKEMETGIEAGRRIEEPIEFLRQRLDKMRALRDRLLSA